MVWEVIDWQSGIIGFVFLGDLVKVRENLMVNGLIIVHGANHFRG